MLRNFSHSSKQHAKQAECVSTEREEGGVRKASWLDFLANTPRIGFERFLLGDLCASSDPEPVEGERVVNICVDVCPNRFCGEVSDVRS